MSGSGDGGGAQGTPKVNTSDFIGFSVDTQGSPGNHHFSPGNYSSPQGHQNPPFFQNNRGKRFNNFNHNNRNSFNNYNNYNNQYNNSPNRSFNRSYNSNHNRSYNSSFNQSQNRSFNNFGHFKAKQDHNNTFNKHLFMHPSFMENPWAELEQKLVQQKSSNASTED
ncbi:GATA zinc finger domain-containing protein 14 [Atheta coriaria]|uniref:GATA zinc finger domain-containing protein 14 n=1 Tax=Dalotia coriaria TaxID=877792 RepID=UPI0031F419C2